MTSFDPDAVRERYREERDKRMVEGRANIRDLTGDGMFASYRADPFTPFIERDPLSEEVEVAIVGAGLAGLCCARRLQEKGISFQILEASDGIGGRVRTDHVAGFLLDRGFQLQADIGQLDIVGLGAQRIGFAVELLSEEIEPAADRTALPDQRPRLRHMRGETVKAVVKLRDSARGLLTEAAFIEWSRQKMAAYKYPRVVEFVETLPKSPTGKILWRELQDKENARETNTP